MSAIPSAGAATALHDAAAKASATANQGAASDPLVSAWVAANAGSGKTHVLAQRVIRLLLAGTPPSRILCLTYTKAAAANMANRVLAILGRWVSLSEPDLDAALQALTGQASDPALRARARRLFAAALETPGGLKIQTIHAFCGGLLHRFPFEAGVAAGFRELDDAARADLLARIRAALVVEASGAPQSRLGRALTYLMGEMTDGGIDALLTAAVAEREAIAALGEDHRSALAQVLGIAPDASVEGIEGEMLDSPHLPRSEWASAAAALMEGSVNDGKRGAALAGAAAAASALDALAQYLAVFLKSDGDPRSDKDLATKAIREAHPGLYARLVAERDRIAGLIDTRRAARVLERSVAAVTLGAAVCARYAAEKAARGALDFDDLVDRTAQMLTNVPSSFVHFKLDQGIDHVLVDEAQDTSPRQWQVIRGLIDDFFSGAGARGAAARTVFVVGDEKQSIFSFQGADPATFAEMRARLANEAGARFKSVRLPHSFRSARRVLEAVDRVFAREEARIGLTADNIAPEHAAIRDQVPTFIEVWPLVEPKVKDEVDDWRRPLDEVATDDPVNTLARRVAGFVKAGIAARLAIPSRQGRAMRAGDVLVLVRRRGKLFEALIRALKEAKAFEVAGADRLVVAEHIAALDLMALGDAVLSPDDDLALGGALKSPLFDFTDDDLMALCPAREGRLADALAARAHERPLWDMAQRRLDAWRAEALRLKPFDFYARVLGRDGGRRAMLARLGPEAGDVLDEFLGLARVQERNEAASLPAFLALLRRGGTEAKRDMESGRDEVRVMTVHGAKGLEAPIVILADTVGVPRSRAEPTFLRVEGTSGHIVPVLAPAKKDRPQALEPHAQSAQARELAEYRRLLYVALTRAEDALVICGAAGQKAPPAGNWYALVEAALEEEAVHVPALGFEGEVLRWRSAEGFAPAVAGTEADEGPPAALPAFRPLPQPARPAVLRPSLAVPREAGAGRARLVAAPETKSAASVPLPPLLRGDLIHRLLAGLADLPVDQRAAAGQRLLDHAADTITADLRAGLLAEALAVLNHAPLAELYGLPGLAEVPIAGHLVTAQGESGRVSGRIDRLAVAPDRLILADYKTDRPAPGPGAPPHPHHVAQVALYGAVLAKAMPGRAVEGLIVYTAAPLAHRVTPAEMAQALARTLSGGGRAPGEA